MNHGALGSKHRMLRRLAAILTDVYALLSATLIWQFTTGSTDTAGHSLPSVPEPSEAAGMPGDYSAARRAPNDPIALGRLDAPVVLSQFTELRCPFSVTVHRDMMPIVIREYVNKGLVPLAHRIKYFEYLGTVYAAAPEHGHADIFRDDLITFARTSGVPDIERFTAELDDPKQRANVQEAGTRTPKVGVNSVPFFLVGNSALSGAQPIENFQQFLDQALDLAL